jgi:hypothetical protein
LAGCASSSKTETEMAVETDPAGSARSKWASRRKNRKGRTAIENSTITYRIHIATTPEKSWASLFPSFRSSQARRKERTFLFSASPNPAPKRETFQRKRERTPRSRPAGLYRRTKSRQSVPDPGTRSRPAASANARNSRSRVRRGTPPSMQLWAISASPRRALRRFASTFARNSLALCQ